MHWYFNEKYDWLKFKFICLKKEVFDIEIEVNGVNPKVSQISLIYEYISCICTI